MKPNLVAIRPSELVILAIHSLGGKSGSSEKKIIRFISRKYGLSEHRLTRKIRGVLAKGLDFGILTCRNGRYDLEDVPEPPSKYPVGQGVHSKDGRFYKRTDGNTSKQKREDSELDRKFPELIEEQIQQWKKDRGFDDNNDKNTGKPMDLDEGSAECVNAAADNTHKFTSPADRVQSTSGSKSRRVRLVSPKSCRKPGKKMITKRSFKTGKGKKPVNKGSIKTRSRPFKTQGISAKYGLRFKQRQAGKRRLKSRNGPKTTAAKVSAKSKPKTCNKICPKGCPKSIQRSKQARAKDVSSQRFNCNPSSTNNNINSNKHFAKNDNTNNNSNNRNSDKSADNIDGKNCAIKSQPKTGPHRPCEKM